MVDMDRTIRFSAADWRDGDKINRDKLATAITGVLTRTLAAKSSAAAWSANTGTLKLTFKRPSQLYSALDLTETVEITALVFPDKPGGSDKLMLWISNPVITTADESAGAKLALAEDSSSDEEGDQKDDNGSVDGAGEGIQGPALGRGQIGLEINPRSIGPGPDPQLVLRRKRSVVGPMKLTKSPCRFQVPASLSAATSSSSACALAGGQARSSIWPATKITVLPATENWPLPPLHHSSSVASPLSPISRFGTRFDPGWRATSSVIAIPNGNSSCARAGKE